MLSKASERSDFICELQCEHIPSRLQAEALKQWTSIVHDACQEQAITYTNLRLSITSRRMVLIIEGIPILRPASQNFIKGPRQGAPEEILDAFCQRVGVSRNDLMLEQKQHNVFWVATIHHPPEDQGCFLKKLVHHCVARFHWPKTMRWGHSRITWIRPLRGLMVLWRGVCLPITLDPEGEPLHSQASTNWGPIHLAPESATSLSSLQDYEKVLSQHGIILSFDERRHHLIQCLKAACPPILSFYPEDFDPGNLLDTVSDLAEKLYVGVGTFYTSFLTLPPSVLKTVMRFHQRAFPMHQANGTLANVFAFISTQPISEAILRGHENVMRGRLNDALFFWQKDLSIPMEQHAQKLKNRQLFHHLGSLWDKQQRLTTLTYNLFPKATWLHQATHLAKADLATEMVEEFPELAGVMGGAYAKAQGLNATIATALAEQASLSPSQISFEGKALILVDALDTLTGFFAQAKAPSGSKDPLALRRTALRVLQHSALDPFIGLNVNELLTQSYTLYGFTQAPLSLEATRQTFWRFMQERWLFWVKETLFMDHQHGKALWQSGHFQHTWDLEKLIQQALLWKKIWLISDTNTQGSDRFAFNSQQFDQKKFDIFKQSWRRVYAYIAKTASLRDETTSLPSPDAFNLDLASLSTPLERELANTISSQHTTDFTCLVKAAPLIDAFLDTLRLDDPLQGESRRRQLNRIYYLSHAVIDLTPLLF